MPSLSTAALGGQYLRAHDVADDAGIRDLTGNVEGANLGDVGRIAGIEDHDPTGLYEGSSDSNPPDRGPGYLLPRFQRGYHGTTIPSVMERAGIGAGSLYRLFESKEALVNAVYRDAKRRLERALSEGRDARRPTGLEELEAGSEYWSMRRCAGRTMCSPFTMTSKWAP